MTVAELKSILDYLPPDAEVFVAFDRAGDDARPLASGYRDAEQGLVLLLKEAVDR